MMVSLRALLFFTLLCGVAYPLAVTAITQLLFPALTSGGIVDKGGHVVGARLLAQEFKQPGRFWPRPSAVAYNPVPSGASNLGPTSKALRDRITADRARGVEGEMLYSSASGLDPEISPEAALAQAPRVAKALGVSVEKVEQLVRSRVEGPQLGFLGEARVNVLELNLALAEAFHE